MICKFLLISATIFSVSCSLLHQVPIAIIPGLVRQDVPNYNYAYEVNDINTGDIKNQQESRRGDTVIGEYSLVQPDGIRRTVAYRADDQTGFLAIVNNHGTPVAPTVVAPPPVTEEAPKNAPEPQATQEPAPRWQWPAQITNETPSSSTISAQDLLRNCPSCTSWM